MLVKLRFLWGVPLFYALVRHQIISLKTRDSRLSYGGNPESLSDLGVIRYRVVTPRQTDGQTDRIPTANTRSQQYLPAQLSRVKKQS